MVLEASQKTGSDAIWVIDLSFVSINSFNSNYKTINMVFYGVQLYAPCFS